MVLWKILKVKERNLVSIVQVKLAFVYLSPSNTVRDCYWLFPVFVSLLQEMWHI